MPADPRVEATVRARAAAQILDDNPTDVEALSAASTLVLRARRWAYEIRERAAC